MISETVPTSAQPDNYGFPPLMQLAILQATRELPNESAQKAGQWGDG